MRRANRRMRGASRVSLGGFGGPHGLWVSPTINAREKDRQQNLALSLLNELRDARIEGNAIAYMSAIRSCEQGA